MEREFRKGRIFAGATNTLAALITTCMLAPPTLAQQADASTAPTATESNPFWDNAKAGYVFRTAYFDRRTGGDDVGAGKYDANAWGIGGWLYGITGEIANFLSFGGTYNFTLPLYGPDSAFSNDYILRSPGHDPISVMGEIYAKLRYENNWLTMGRQEINNSWYMQDVVRFYNTIDQSMIGRNDIRGMQPMHFTGVTAKGRLFDDTLRYYGGYIWGVRGNGENSDSNDDYKFRSLGAYATGNTSNDTDGGVYLGLQYKPTKDSMLEGSYYAFQDLLNMAYLSGDYVFRLEDKNYLRFGAQYFYQDGNGKNFLSGGKDFSTESFALYSEFKFNPYVLPYLSFGETGKDQEIRSPFAIGPHYATQRIKAMPAAGEKTLFVGALFDFTPFGAKGLTFDVAYADRGDRRANFNGAALPDWKEFSTDLVYIHPGEGFFKNMRTRLRWATVTESGANLVGDRNWQDIRFDVSLNIPFK